MKNRIICKNMGSVEVYTAEESVAACWLRNKFVQLLTCWIFLYWYKILIKFAELVNLVIG